MYASARRLWVRALELFLIVPSALSPLHCSLCIVPSAQGDSSYEREKRGERFILLPPLRSSRLVFGLYISVPESTFLIESSVLFQLVERCIDGGRFCSFSDGDNLAHDVAAGEAAAAAHHILYFLG